MARQMATELPLSALKARCHVNPAANRIGNAPDFSRLIRKGIPGFENQ